MQQRLLGRMRMCFLALWVRIDGPGYFSVYCKSMPQALCCPAHAALATRWLLQDEMHLANTRLDACVGSLTLCLRAFLRSLACYGSASDGALGAVADMPSWHV